MLVMQKVLNHEDCVMLMTFFPIFVILILIWLFLCFFLFVEKTDWLSLSKRRDNSWDFILSFCKSLRGLPQIVCFVWFSHLTILEWRQWSHLTFNQSTEILIPGVSPFFFLKTSIILHNKNIRGFGTDRMHHGRMAMVTLWCMTKWKFFYLRL